MFHTRICRYAAMLDGLEKGGSSKADAAGVCELLLTAQIFEFVHI